MKIEWIEGQKGALFSEIAKIRQEVFTKEQGFPEEVDLDEYDATAWHLALVDLSGDKIDLGEAENPPYSPRGEAIGTLRIYALESGEYQIGRVALLKPYRKQGLGQKMMRAALKKAEEILQKEQKAQSHLTLTLNAQVAAINFYQTLGFTPVSEPFLEEGEPHITMKRTITEPSSNLKIPQEILQNADKVLFIVHLAIGDFTYLQNGFKAFAEQFPHIKVDLWIDEVRRTSDASKWPFLKKYSLYDWAEESDIFNKVYRETYSPELFEKSIKSAQAEKYPLVISLATLRPQNYALLARKIAGVDGFVATMDFKAKFYQLKHRKARESADLLIERACKDRPKNYHISEDYAHWFSQIGVSTLTERERYPFVNIPEEWTQNAKEKLQQWRVKPEQKIVLINHIAKNKRRSWELSQVAELIKKMQKLPEWKDTFFLINGIPQILPEIEQMVEESSLKNSMPFSATDNFFELPAMLAECDLIISVETAVMHLANAVHVPVIALMRLKTPEWQPLNKELTTVIFTPLRKHVMKDISVDRVIEALPEALKCTKRDS